MSGERDLDFLDSHFESAGITDDTGQQDDTTQPQPGTDQPTSPPPPPPPPRPTQKPDPSVPPTTQQATTTPQPPTLKYDDKGNVVDEHGRIVAQTGQQRRIYERQHQLQTELVSANGRLHVYERIPKELGLSPPEVEFGIRAAKAYKTDPIDTARWFVKQALARGGTLNQILGEHAQQLTGAPIQTDAIKSMISELLKPILDDRTARVQQTELDQSVQREYDDFVSTHDHALVHDAVFAEMIRNDPALTPDGAYWRLRAFADRNQFDFTKPLGPQVTARQATGASPQSQTTTGTQRPMPNGSGTTQSEHMKSNVDRYGLETPDDIIRGAMRDAGYTVQ